MKKLTLAAVALTAVACSNKNSAPTPEPDVNDAEYTIIDESEGTWSDMEREVLGDDPSADDSLKSELRRLFRKKHGL